MFVFALFYGLNSSASSDSKWATRWWHLRSASGKTLTLSHQEALGHQYF